MATASRPAKDRLTACHIYLVKQLDVQRYVDLLFKEGVLSEEQKDKLTKLRDERMKCASRLVDMLLDKPESTIDKFFKMVEAEKDHQPDVYKIVFPEHDVQETWETWEVVHKEDCADGTDDHQSAGSRGVESKVKEDPDWKERFIPHMPAVAAELRPSLLIDHLRASWLLTKNEYEYLVCSYETEESLSQKLFKTLLEKGVEPFRKFLGILLMVEGQEEVARKILQITGLSVGEGHAPAMPKQEPTKRVTFVVEQRHHESVRQRRACLEGLCQDLFGLAADEVQITSNLPSLFTNGYPCLIYDLKLVSLILHGLECKVKQERMADCITSFVNGPNPEVLLEPVEVLEALRSKCTFVVIRMQFDACLAFLCTLAKEGQIFQLGASLQEYFPGVHKAELRFGGLPSIELLGDTTVKSRSRPDKKRLDAVSSDKIDEGEMVGSSLTSE